MIEIWKVYYFLLNPNSNQKKPVIPVIIGKGGSIILKYFNTAQSENQTERVMDCLKLNASLPHVILIKITIKTYSYG